jgi:hypothetical protein
MLDGVLHCIVVDAMPISAIDALRSMFCQSVDLLGRRKCWRATAARLGRSSGPFAIYWYDELP